MQQPPGSQPSTSPTEQKLQQAERKDSGRGLEWFYIQAESGYQHVGLQTFKSDLLTYGDVNSTGNGVMVGGALGVRLLFFTFGARGRLGMFSDWDVATINGEFGFHIPVGNLEPYVTLGGGYAFLTDFDASKWGSEDVSVDGYNVRLAAGLDYYVTPVFSVGALLSGEMLGLWRSGLALDSNAPVDARVAAAADGSSVGASFTGSLVLGLHF